MAVFRRGDLWWYEFWFAGRRIRESTKSASKTLAKTAEQKRRRELESGFNNFENVRHARVRTLSDLADEYFQSYELRNPRSAVFADYAIAHITRLLGMRMMVDCNEALIGSYQTDRLKEGAAPKTVNEEVGFLLRILGDQGDLLRIRLKKRKLLALKVRRNVGKAFAEDEKKKLLAEAKRARSPHIYPALTLALNAGIRDTELKHLTWAQVDLQKKYLTVGKSKTDAGEGRTIPLNSMLFEVLNEYAEWYRLKFEEIRPEWYLFPFGRPGSSDPTRPVTTLKTAWNNVRKKAGVEGRWHDNRHTLITDLAESGAGDQTIMDIAGHVSKQMLKHYSHIRMKAKRNALEAIVNTPAAGDDFKTLDGQTPEIPTKRLSRVSSESSKRGGKSEAASPSRTLTACSDSKAKSASSPRITRPVVAGYPQKSPQSRVPGSHRTAGMGFKLLKGIGSSGRTRTYNPSVNSRMLCH